MIFKLKDKEIKQFKLVSGTRRTVLKKFDGGYYGNDMFRKKWHDFFEEKLPKGMCVYYEIVGWVNESMPIMGRCNNKLVKDKEFEKMYSKEKLDDGVRYAKDLKDRYTVLWMYEYVK